MKILVVSHSCVIPVNQQVYIDLAEQPDVDLRLILPANFKDEYTGRPIAPQYLPGIKFPVYPMPVANSGSVNLHFYRRLPKAELDRWIPDVVLASQEPYSLSAWQALGLARRYQARFAFQTNQNIEKRYPPPFSWIERACLREAMVAMAYSAEAGEVMRRKGRKGTVAIVPYATDVRLFAPLSSQDSYAQNVAALRQQFGFEPEDFVVGFLGRLIPEKGIDTLLEAVARLSTALPVIKVLLVGTGSQEEALRQRAMELGLVDRVVFAGLVAHSEAGKYMACFNALVLPSRTTPGWKEQFGRVIIEALATAVPVIGSDSGQIPVLLQETGGGMVFREGDAPDLAGKIETLAQNATLCRTLGQRGYQTVQEKFTCQAVARQMLGLLRLDSATPHSKAAAAAV